MQSNRGPILFLQSLVSTDFGCHVLPPLTCVSSVGALIWPYRAEHILSQPPCTDTSIIWTILYTRCPKKRTFRFAMNWLPMINIKQCGGQELIIRSQFMAILKLRFLLGHPVYLCQGKRNKYIWAEAVFTAVYVMVLHFRWYFIVCILKFWFSQNQGCADDILKTVRRIENSIWESRMDSVLVGEGR